jgi:hypothetical protein
MNPLLSSCCIDRGRAGRSCAVDILSVLAKATDHREKERVLAKDLPPSERRRRRTSIDTSLAHGAREMCSAWQHEAQHVCQRQHLGAISGKVPGLQRKLRSALELHVGWALRGRLRRRSQRAPLDARGRQGGSTTRMDPPESVATTNGKRSDRRGVGTSAWTCGI